MFNWFRKEKCGATHQMLSAYIDGQLDSQEQELVESHIETCHVCQAKLDSLRQTVGLLHRMPVVHPTRSFAVTEVSPALRKATFTGLRIATAAAALLLVLIFSGDILHTFDTPPLTNVYEVPPPVQLEPEETPPDRYTWPVREAEYSLLGVTIILGAVTIIYWQRARRKKPKQTRKWAVMAKKR
jgi:hypothetical protein